MYLVVNAKGQYWDGLGWSEQGREFFSIAAAHRSLHEEGEDIDNAVILDAEGNDPA